MNLTYRTKRRLQRAGLIGLIVLLVVILLILVGQLTLELLSVVLTAQLL